MVCLPIVYYYNQCTQGRSSSALLLNLTLVHVEKQNTRICMASHLFFLFIRGERFHSWGRVILLHGEWRKFIDFEEQKGSEVGVRYTTLFFKANRSPFFSQECCDEFELMYLDCITSQKH